MFYTIKQPENEEQLRQYYHLRWQLLRAPWNQPQGSEVDAIEAECLHFIAINKQQQVIGVARLQFNSESEAQIRYMAVLESHQKQGIGRALDNAIVQYAAKNNGDNIVLDAREDAVDFYKKLGYRQVEKSYLLFEKIQHFRMFKSLTGNIPDGHLELFEKRNLAKNT